MEVKNAFSSAAGALALTFVMGPAAAQAVNCDGTQLLDVGGVPRTWKLADGGVAAYAKMNINIDGYGRAYHPKNAAGGALIHLCNAGRPYAPDGSSYNASEDNATCTGPFMDHYARVKAAGWKDPNVGAINWFGVLGREQVKLDGTTVTAVVPVLQPDGSGFYVSPTALADETIANKATQSRYVHPLRVPAAVVPRSVAALGIKMGSFGVAYNAKTRITVPFVVGDGGPKIGEGSVALARLVSGLPIKDPIDRSERYQGIVETKDVLWVYFADAAAPFDSKKEGETVQKSRDAFQAWGGDVRLAQCIQRVPRN
jgi:hypothetical protein